LKNKDIALISSFKVFLKGKLYQDNINEMIIRRDNRVDIGVQLDWVRSANMSPRVVEDPSMFGNWVYGIFVQNGSLRTKVMDRLVKELPDILQRSSEEVVAAFISGVIEQRRTWIVTKSGLQYLCHYGKRPEHPSSTYSYGV
jgi:hypothetical protein